MNRNTLTPIVAKGLHLLCVAALAIAASAWLAPIPVTNATFPGLNGKIAFFSQRAQPAPGGDIFVMNDDGTDVTRLTTDPAQDNFPAWSPDGTEIAFNSNRTGIADIFVMNADGTDQTNLTNNAAEDDSPAWSPDGTKIAFRSNRDGNFEIYVMNADGGGISRLTYNPGEDASPAWSPDGAKIAFHSSRDGIYEIFVMNAADGSGQTNLTNGPGGDVAPDWSPDGTQLLFNSTRDGDYEVFVMNADGTSVTQLTFNSVEDVATSWSPDGTQIAFQSQIDGNPEIYVMNADGSGMTRLTNNPAQDNLPDWQSLHYNFTGFFPPVDNPPMLNVMKAGSAIPVKFSLDGNQGLNIFAAGYPKSQQISCDLTAPLDSIEQSVTSGLNRLSYDATTDQYTYVWKTDKAWANSCRQLTVRLNDGTDHIAYFNFTK